MLKEHNRAMAAEQELQSFTDNNRDGTAHADKEQVSGPASFQSGIDNNYQNQGGGYQEFNIRPGSRGGDRRPPLKDPGIRTSLINPQINCLIEEEKQGHVNNRGYYGGKYCFF